ATTTDSHARYARPAPAPPGARGAGRRRMQVWPAGPSDIIPAPAETKFDDETRLTDTVPPGRHAARSPGDERRGARVREGGQEAGPPEHAGFLGGGGPPA